MSRQESSELQQSDDGVVLSRMLRLELEAGKEDDARSTKSDAKSGEPISGVAMEAAPAGAHRLKPAPQVSLSMRAARAVCSSKVRMR